MRLAIHGRLRSPSDMERLQHIVAQVRSVFNHVSYTHQFANGLKKAGLNDLDIPTAKGPLSASATDMLVSIGGDGTILEAARMVGRSGIPVLGINNGRLGFLSSIPHDETEQALKRIANGDYLVEQRSLVQLNSDEGFELNGDFALNEITVHKSARSSMIVVHAYLDGNFLNTYWADGLIIATPTGSTGYSLSAGGPIVSPTSRSLVVTPIAPHNLNVRPLVLPDTHRITLRVEEEGVGHLISLDSNSRILRPHTALHVATADFTVGMVRFSKDDYFNTLRSKLMWGIDRRN
jgi:NAD+ kinase